MYRLYTCINTMSPLGSIKYTVLLKLSLRHPIVNITKFLPDTQLNLRTITSLLTILNFYVSLQPILEWPTLVQLGYGIMLRLAVLGLVGRHVQHSR